MDMIAEATIAPNNSHQNATVIHVPGVNGYIDPKNGILLIQIPPIIIYLYKLFP